LGGQSLRPIRKERDGAEGEGKEKNKREEIGGLVELKSTTCLRGGNAAALLTNPQEDAMEGCHDGRVFGVHWGGKQTPLGDLHHSSKREAHRSGGIHKWGKVGTKIGNSGSKSDRRMLEA